MYYNMYYYYYWLMPAVLCNGRKMVVLVVHEVFLEAFAMHWHTKVSQENGAYDCVCLNIIAGYCR